MKQNARQLITGLIFTSLMIFLDQFTKAIAVSKLKGKEAFVLIDGVFEFQYLENYGAAFSSMLGKTTFLLIFTGVISLILAVIYVKTPPDKKWMLLRILLCALFAGGIGNFIDRFRFGYVVDFMSFVLIHFPIFNVADIYITVSIVVLFVAVMWIYKDEDWDELKQRILPGKK